jgi:hypothetical protein
MANNDVRKEIGQRTEDSSEKVGSEIPHDTLGPVIMPVETLQEQADHLGLLDPLDVEPAHVYVPDRSKP